MKTALKKDCWCAFYVWGPCKNESTENLLFLFALNSIKCVHYWSNAHSSFVWFFFGLPISKEAIRQVKWNYIISLLFIRCLFRSIANYSFGFTISMNGWSCAAFFVLSVCSRRKLEQPLIHSEIERTPKRFTFAVGIISIFAYFCCEWFFFLILTNLCFWGRKSNNI